MLFLFGPHQVAAALDAAAQTLYVVFYAELILVPLVVHGQLFAHLNFATREQTNLVQRLALVLPAQVETLHVWVAAVVDKPRLVAIKETVQTQREELVVVRQLDRLLALLVLAGVVHVEQVAQPNVVVIRSAHVALLFSHYFPAVLHDKRPGRNFFPRDNAPHNGATFFLPLNEEVPGLLVFGRRQVVLAHVLVAAAKGVALVVTEHLVYARGCSLLKRYHLSVLAQLLLVSRVLQFLVPLVALAPPARLAPVKAGTKRCPLVFLLVNLNILIERDVLRNILHRKSVTAGSALTVHYLFSNPVAYGVTSSIVFSHITPASGSPVALMKKLPWLWGIATWLEERFFQ